MGLIALMNYFTVESEIAICDLRHDRRGIAPVRQKFQTAVQKLISTCLRGMFKTDEHGTTKSINKLQRKRCEALIMVTKLSPK